jgi:hypothetical protein
MSLAEEYRTKCPFCSMQDDLILRRGNPNSALFGKDNLFGLYVDERNDRGLCPRGNFTTELLTSPYRLRNVMVNGKPYGMDDAIKECSSILKEISKGKNEVAILMGGNHSLEEAYLAREFCNQLNTELIGIFPFEDEALLSVKNDFSFDEISSSDLVFTIGDIFSHSPTMAKPIINARNKKRGNRLLYLDIVGGRVSPFASNYIVRPGYTAYFLSILLDFIKGKKKNIVLEKTGIGLSSPSIKEIETALKESNNGWIIFSNIYGHFANSLTIVGLLGEIARRTDNHFAVVPVAQNSLGVGRVIGKFGNEDIMNRLMNKKLKGMMSFGGLLPELLTGFNNYVDNLSFVLSTTILKYEDFPGYLFPTTLSIEKEGSIVSLEEEVVSLGDAVPPVPGAVSDGVLISNLMMEISGKEIKAPVGGLMPVDGKSRGLHYAPQAFEDEEFPFTLVGIGLPYHHSNGEISRRMAWNIEKGGPYLFLNPSQKKKLGLGRTVTVVTPYSSCEFEIGSPSESPYNIPEGVLALPTHYPETRELFPIGVDNDGMLSPGAVKARLEQ